MEWLTSLPREALSLSGLLALVFLFVMAGKLVPASRLADVRKDRDDRLAEKQAELDRARDEFEARITWITEDKNAQITDWRDAYRVSEARGDVLAGQVDELVRQGRTTEHVLSSLLDVVRGRAL